MGRFSEAVEGFNNSIGIIHKAEDIISEAVEDKDLRNKYNLEMAKLRCEVKKAFAAAQTIPWMDGLYKLGSHITNVITIAVIGIGTACGHTWTFEEITGLLGCNGIYQARKAHKQKVGAEK